MMGRTDVAKRVAERLGLPVTQVRKVLDAMVQVKAEALADGRPVVFGRFGAYRLKRKRARMAHNVNTGESALLPECVSVQFRPSRQLGLVLNASTAARCHIV